MEPPQCVEELEDDVFQPEDGEPGTQPGSLLSADLFAQSQLDCPLSRLHLFPLTHCCGPGLRPTSQEDKATQTLSPASPSQGVMLPCGVTEEPQRLFYGNAGYRLPLPASFPAGLPLLEQPPEGQWQHRAEVQIARKLQCIADQFHRLHMQQVGTGAGSWAGAGGESAGAGGWGWTRTCLSHSVSAGTPRAWSRGLGLGCCGSGELGGPNCPSTPALSELQVGYLPPLGSGF
uniref:Bcl2 modifying factor n=1 Tax=Canis lupus familiaris TaxID=9615 RepID=A0A8C0PT40_CANLF